MPRRLRGHLLVLYIQIQVPKVRITNVSCDICVIQQLESYQLVTYKPMICNKSLKNVGFLVLHICLCKHRVDF